MLQFMNQKQIMLSLQHMDLAYDSGNFTINGILPLEAIFLRDICNWSILMID